MFGRNAKKKSISSENQVRFDFLKATGLKLSKEVPLMPAIETGGFRSTLRLMKKIKLLPAGTAIVFDDIQMRGPRAWYRVHVKDKLVAGWINSVVFEGM